MKFQILNKKMSALKNQRGQKKDRTTAHKGAFLGLR